MLASCVVLLLCVLILSVLDPTVVRAADDKVIRLGVILPRNETIESIANLWTLPKTEPAIRYAVSSIANNSNILAGYELQIVIGDSECSDVYGPLSAFDMYITSPVHVYIGPACEFSVAPVARYASVWNIPVMTAGALAQAFQNKDEFALLTRMTSPYTKLAIFVNEMMSRLNWNVRGMLYNAIAPSQGRSTCHFIMEPIYTAKKNTTSYLSINKEGATDEKIKEALLEISKSARIILMCFDEELTREILINAAELGMDNGEYVFIDVNVFAQNSNLKKIRPWHRENDPRNALAERGYSALLIVSVLTSKSEEYNNFSRQMNEEYGTNDKEVNNFVIAFHDAIILYANALNRTLADGFNATDGKEVIKRMWNTTIKGIGGNVTIDANGDRAGDYSLRGYQPATQDFAVVGYYYGSTHQYVQVPDVTIHWPAGGSKAPLDVPKCGFDGSLCPPFEMPWWGYVGIVVVSIAFIALAVWYCRPGPPELDDWTIQWDDIMFEPLERRPVQRTSSQYTVATITTIDEIDARVGNGHINVMANIGNYRGLPVSIKKIPPLSWTRTHPPLVDEIRNMKDLSNDHLVRFIGACIEEPNFCILTEYCKRGSLSDVLRNRSMELDLEFRYSLIQDIVRGMTYLHNSEIRSHGNLKSSNCIVDSRFVLKITDFGLHYLRGTQDGRTISENKRKMLWTAPELLRMALGNGCFPPEGTQKGDVYSFAIICQEIIYRKGAFWRDGEEPCVETTFERITRHMQPFYRPTLFENDFCPESFVDVVVSCWEEDPSHRPDFQPLKNKIKSAFHMEDESENIVEVLMLKHTAHLENLVEQRTSQYLVEKRKAEDLLYRMLPPSVAHELMTRNEVQAEKFDSVSIYFSDICGFTKMVSELPPMHVIDVLNALYKLFDSIIGNFHVYKVETIGDAYMVVSGLPERNELEHARQISLMALAILNAVRSFVIPHMEGEELKIRIGLHSGSVCAGVVGDTMPRYCLFGDTVNTASRMESNGLPLKIHLSPYTKEILDAFGGFHTELRGPVEMKGKGTIVTWWLLGADSDTRDATHTV